MYDIHAHILPALDDGPRTFEEAVTTAVALAREGVTEVIATPHYAEQYGRLDAAEVEQRVAALQRVLQRVRVPLRLRAGHEAPLTDETEELLARGVIATLNDGPYVLVSLPSRLPLTSFLPRIASLRQKGFIPVLAHAERYAPVIENPAALTPLVEAGALVQITASSLTSAAPETTRRTADELLACNLAHLLASGTHGVQQQALRFAEGVRAAQEIVGPERIWELVVETPKAVAQGDPVHVPPVRARGKHHP